MGSNSSGGDVWTTYSAKSIHSRLTFMDIRSLWDFEGPPAPFEPCRSDHPNHKSLSDRESDYYFYWRSMIRKGRYLRTSDGYLYLFTCEIINMDRDVRNSLNQMVGAIKVYRNHSPALLDMMSDACLTFAKINKLPEPELERGSGLMIRSYLLEKRLEMDPIGFVPASLIAPNLTAKDRQHMDPRDPYDELFTECLRRIDAWQKDVRRKRLADYMPDASRKQYAVYEGFMYYGVRARASLECRFAFNDFRFLSFVKETLRRLIATICESRGQPMRLLTTYPAQYCVIITDLVNEWLGGSWKPEDLHDDGFELDGLMVRNARRDLDAVTDLMSIEEDEIPETGETETEEIQSGEDGDPWSRFASSLDETGRGYLSASLKGEGRVYIESIGIRMKAMEDSVNTIAMDIIGDTVVEDGSIVSEYEEDIRRSIR